ncbi:hypothetical protein BGP_6407 [Beggiatoa sp. PS]|nr:hypothetical protein BGP_6407 [Beggiatoa sp. PS]
MGHILCLLPSFSLKVWWIGNTRTAILALGEYK